MEKVEGALEYMMGGDRAVEAVAAAAGTTMGGGGGMTTEGAAADVTVTKRGCAT